MSPTVPANTTLSSSSNFQLIFDTAVEAYEKQTKRKLLAHPLALQLQKCDTPASIFAVLQCQVDDLEQARKGDERLTKWLGPTIHVLIAFSDTLGEGVSLVRLKAISFWSDSLTKITQVFSPAKVIFAGAGVLLQVCTCINVSLQPEIDTECR